MAHVVDVETGGVDPLKAALLSIGAVDLQDPDRRFYGECRPGPGLAVDNGALRVNGFTPKYLANPDLQTEAKLVQTYLDWVAQMEDQTFIAQHPAFDMGFIKAAAARSDIKYRPGGGQVDLFSVAYALYLRTGHTPPLLRGRTVIKSDEIHRFCGIPPEPKPHNGLNGAMWEAEAYWRLVFGESRLLEFAGDPIPSYLRVEP